MGAGVPVRERPRVERDGYPFALPGPQGQAGLSGELLDWGWRGDRQPADVNLGHIAGHTFGRRAPM